jgi:phosphoribosylaminoimidazole (AIR) synthetase
MGIGMILIVAPEYADAAISKIEASGDKAYPLGEMVTQASDEGVVDYVG